MSKRRKVPPLFVDQEPPTYVMDSSAWFDVDKLPNAAVAWAIIEVLTKSDRLVCPIEVLNELQDDEPLWARLKPLDARLRSGARTDEEFFLLAGRIAYEFRQLAGIRSRKTKADPFVIALAELEHYVIVSNESLRRPSRKIPGVCAKRNNGVQCLTLLEMLAAEQSA